MNNSEPNQTQFFYKKDVSNIPKEAVWLSDEVFCIPKKTRFGDVIPQIEEFLKFINVPFFTQGFSNYNSFGFTTQVPAVVNLLVPVKLNIKSSYWKKVYPLTQADPELFKQFTQIEYSLYDCLINFENLGDGYFTEKKAQAKYTIKLCKTLKDHYKDQLDLEKLFQKASEKNPKLLEYFPNKLSE